MMSPIKVFLLSTFAIATMTKAAVISSDNASKISPEIISELKDFADLIPTATVHEIVAKHYVIDSNFREVFKYVRSSQFTELLQQAQQIPEILDILDYLHVLAPDAAAYAARLRTTYDTVNMARSSDVQMQLFEPQLNFVLLNDLESDVIQAVKKENDFMELIHTPSPTSPPAHHLRTFNSFVEELMGHLPRNQYVQLINQKRQKKLTFAQFYTALRSVELRPMVDATLKSSNLSSIIKMLRSNGVDVKSLETIAFKVISWGPALISLP
ncbi:uncharacterized protein jtb [Eurosta solidaginis]|uniref:uncharacterized protein jtb n=1 Tax=Eurosta solidaginis TaxID=178769 RepID=UPI0035313D24